MRRWICAVVAGLSFVSSRTRAAPSGDCEHIVEGLVIDADLETPLPGVRVELRSGDRVGIDRTDGAGRFRVPACRGEARLVAAKAGFSPERLSLSVPIDGPVRIRLRFPVQTVVVEAPPDVDPLADLGFETTLDGAALTARRGLGLAETLEGEGGVTVLRSGAVAKPVIDGFYGNRILLLNDGLRHHAQLWALDHAPEIDASAAGRITVIRGAEGVRYGADAVGGAIAVEPPPYLEPDESGLRGSASLLGASNGGRGAASARAVGNAPGLPRLGLRLQASGHKSGARLAPDYPLDNTGSEELSGSVSAAYRGDGSYAELGVSYLSTRYGLFSGIRAESFADFETVIAAGEPPAVEDYRFDYGIERPFSTVEHAVVRAELRADLAGGELRALYGLQDNDRREFDLARGATSGAQLRLHLVSHALRLAYDRELSPGLAAAVGLSGLAQTNDHAGDRLIPDYERLVGGAFALARWVAEPWSVAAGLRFERQALDTEQPARIAPNRNPPDRASLDFEAVMATAELGWSPGPGWSLELHLASATRIPTVDELFLEGLVPGEVFYVQGDRTLSPEQSRNLGFGARYEGGWLAVEALAFLHWIQDYIQRSPRLTPDGRPDPFEQLIQGRFPAQRYENVDALQGGGSLELTLEPVTWLELRSSVQLVEARNLSRDEALIGIPPYRWTNRLKAEASEWGPLEDLEFWARATYVARQDDFPPAELVPPPPDYLLFDLGLGFDLGPARFNLEVRNLLDASYRDYLSRLRYFSDEPGLDAALRVEIPFGASWAP